MEEVWNDINLTSSNPNPNPSSAADRRSCHGMIFQDFFTPPSTPKRPATKFRSTPPLQPAPPRPPPLASTSLSLSTSTATGVDLRLVNPCQSNTSNFHDQIFIGSSGHAPQLLGAGGGGGSGAGPPYFINTSPFETLASSPASLISSFYVKKGSEKNDQSASDPRYKRMMKNRESAARSRARRQEILSRILPHLPTRTPRPPQPPASFPAPFAYTFELERERTQLMEENEMLKGQVQEQKLRAAAAAIEIPKKPSHSRSLTAPF